MAVEVKLTYFACEKNMNFGGPGQNTMDSIVSPTNLCVEASTPNIIFGNDTLGLD